MIAQGGGIRHPSGVMKSLPATACATRILVVDDEKPVRDIIAYTLCNEGYQVVAAANGNEAMDLARMMRFDLVITDMVMPEKEGIETIMELRAQAPGIRIIAMSGGQPGEAGDFLPLAKTLGAVAVLRKPFDMETFLGTVKEAAGSGRDLTGTPHGHLERV
jgi:CheY-like chemotaxis protein